MAYDVLTAARALRDELDAAAHHNWSREIDDAIAGGSTGTEILMRLRGVLTRLAPAVHQDRPAIAARAHAIEAEITGILGGSR
ncbi:MAG: hypothetical protein PIR02_06235 [Microbacterium enclense]